MWLTGIRLTAFELFIGIVVLFLSGFAAWSQERRKNDNRWRGLTDLQRNMIADRLRPFAPYPELAIYTNRVADCQTFAADLCEALSRAIETQMTMPSHQVVNRWIPSGIVILTRPDDERGPKLKAALKTVADIDARLETKDQV